MHGLLASAVSATRISSRMQHVRKTRKAYCRADDN